MKKTIPLKKNYEFMRLYKKGRFFAGRYLVIYVQGNTLGVNRLGIAISRKVGGSVRRNRIKRLIRENYRYYEDFVADGVDIVFMARGSETEYEFDDIKKEMKFLLKKVQVFDREKWDSLEKS